MQTARSANQQMRLWELLHSVRTVQCITRITTAANNNFCQRWEVNAADSLCNPPLLCSVLCMPSGKGEAHCLHLNNDMLCRLAIMFFNKPEKRREGAGTGPAINVFHCVQSWGLSGAFGKVGRIRVSEDSLPFHQWLKACRSGVKFSQELSVVADDTFCLNAREAPA